MVEVKTEPKTRVKECQGYGGAQHDKERERERMGANGRKLQKKSGDGGEERKGRYEGRRDTVRRRGSDNKRGIARDISSGQNGLKE